MSKKMQNHDFDKVDREKRKINEHVSQLEREQSERNGRLGNFDFCLKESIFALRSPRVNILPNKWILHSGTVSDFLGLQGRNIFGMKRTIIFENKFIQSSLRDTFPMIITTQTQVFSDI